MSVKVFSEAACQLGEGPIWHPKRQELCWFDILNKRLYARGNGQEHFWEFDEFLSAAGWIDEDHLLIATQSSLQKFQFSTGSKELVIPLEEKNLITRSNDGRADPWGGFWIGTMGLNAEHQAGAIYRYFKGELRQLFPNLTIPNAICFSPNRRWGYFACTHQAKIWRQRLNQINGWPAGEPELFIDFAGTGINPDGAVCDDRGNLWNAQWGSGRVARYSPDGAHTGSIDLPTSHTTCPAFGGDDLSKMYVTSATQGLSPQNLTEQPSAGHVFVAKVDVHGQREHQIVL